MKTKDEAAAVLNYTVTSNAHQTWCVMTSLIRKTNSVHILLRVHPVSQGIAKIHDDMIIVTPKTVRN